MEARLLMGLFPSPTSAVSKRGMEYAAANRFPGRTADFFANKLEARSRTWSGCSDREFKNRKPAESPPQRAFFTSPRHWRARTMPQKILYHGSPPAVNPSPRLVLLFLERLERLCHASPLFRPLDRTPAGHASGTAAASLSASCNACRRVSGNCPATVRQLSGECPRIGEVSADAS